MNLHVFRLDKFIPPFMAFCRERLPDHDNHFHVVDNERDFPYQDGPDSHLQTSRLGYLKLFWKMYRARRIILHNLLDIHVVLFLALNPWLLKKCYWVIWGFDLYLYHQRHAGWKFRANECLRRIVIKHMGYLLTYVPGDVALARQWYRARGQHLDCIMYPSNVFTAPDVVACRTRERRSGLTVQVGNSADPSNNHLQTFEKLASEGGRGYRVLVPLAYGDAGYAKKVISAGERLFGEAFHPITGFMPYPEYLKMLGDIDIAIFAHDRQQAMGNIVSLLGLGKTVYLKPDITSAQFLRDQGLTFRDAHRLALETITKQESDRNRELIEAYFSMQRLTFQWQRILG
ncbi:MAG: hypothetical protein FH757_09265 [Alcanivorax sp.]|nr:hypothetical protein [Alcanivorax sp.]